VLVMNMFCYQCEQTAKGTGCTANGVCGKDPETAALQDALVHAVKGLAMYAHRAHGLGVSDRETNVFTVEALFATLTNVNFDPESLRRMVLRAAELRDRARRLYEEACRSGGRRPEKPDGPAVWTPSKDMDELIRQGEDLSTQKRIDALGEDVAGLQSLVLFGVKGAASYADHAQILGKEDDAVYRKFHEMLDYLATNPTDGDDLLARALQAGELNLRTMALLDAAHTGTYGNPEPTPVRITPRKGKAVAVSGHDMKDVEELLKQTAGKGINVYTHGEALAAHGYPGLKKYKHLVGNYGGAWQDQRQEFDRFPGAILMTTNCLQKPKDSYKGRLFTSGVVGWPGVVHIGDRNFGPVIQAAVAAEGFKEDGPDKTILVG
jgi:hydroxylamine reductase